ncbi:MAG: acetyl-CoA carboxylase biotin carboxylase subunit [Dehalococcoidia bacterium]|nr:acetyl-CoA carboxylase biotin carboxylase subunit [Dehalococcoidia bacterium]
MFGKILVANRGEIAVRILRAAHDLGIEVVAVYSEADRGALHVRLADEAYLIGPPAPKDSYLNQQTIIEVARKSGAEAIHPGYGFLAENAAFARACDEAGIAFIGPPASAIAAMGDKLASRELVAKASVPLVPGTEQLANAEEAVSAIRRLGLPVMIKASAGGGGRGMRVVEHEAEVENAVRNARAEAGAAFGNEAIYIEKLFRPVRHIEIQVMGDKHGNVVAHGERECSIQRRHQKVIEEAPSTAVDDDLRQRMREASISATKAVGYYSAGTIEYLVDSEGNFYFLEMNTRLQVEHPVTELVTGVDLVTDQIRVAAGEPLGYRQEDIEIRGWALECRITAEDPYNGFLPSVGRVSYASEPSGPGVRIDSALYSGFEVTPFYDSLLAKLCTWGSTRDQAIERMKRALSEMSVAGVATTIPFHLQVMDTPDFRAGKLDTGFIERNFVAEPEPARPDETLAAVIGATILADSQKQTVAQTAAPDGAQPAASPWKMAGRARIMSSHGVSRSWGPTTT